MIVPDILKLYHSVISGCKIAGIRHSTFIVVPYLCASTSILLAIFLRLNVNHILTLNWSVRLFSSIQHGREQVSIRQ